MTSNPPPISRLSHSSLVAASPDAILFADGDAHYVDANPAAEALLGFSRAELLDLRVHDVVVEGPEWTDAEYDKFVKAGHWRGQVALRRKDGTVVRASAQAVTLELPDGLVHASVLREGELPPNRASQLATALTFDTLTSSLDLDEALPALVGQLREVLATDVALVMLLDEPGGELVLRASAGIPQERGRRVAVGKGVVGRVAAAREPVVIDDFASLSVSERTEQLRSVAALPVFSRSELLGVLAVGTLEPRHFADEDMALLRLGAERAGRCIERAALYAAERQARETAEWAATRLRLALAGGSMATWEWDLDTGQITWSAELEALYGLPAGALADRADAFLAHVHPDDRPLLQAAVASFDVERNDALVEYRVMQPDGSTRWLAARGRLGQAADGGRGRRILGASMDVTDRKVAEQAHSRSVAQQALMAELSQALAEVGPQTSALLDHFVRQIADAVGDICTVRLLSADGEWLETAAVHARDEAVAAELRMALAGTRQRSNYGIGGRVITSGVSQKMDLATRAQLERDNIPELRAFLDHVPITSYLAMPLRSRGRLLGTVHLSRRPPAAAFTDDERLSLEALVDRLALALDNAALFEAERRARREAELAIQTRDEFLSGVTHDLQNPLAVIRAQVGLFARRLARGQTLTTAQLETGFERLTSTATRMSRQVQELLDLARLELGQTLELQAEPVDLVPMVRQLVDELESSHLVQLEVAEASLTGLFDPLRIERVFANLLDNAVKYSPAGETVLVRIFTEQRDGSGVAVVEVVDRGIGIPEAELPRVFERFFRATNTSGRISGSGVGLATAQQIVNQHRGALLVTSQPGRGSTFRVELPLQ